mmetsp:Transcript_100177/g.289252  ORF Transcript_100177/g.289252 Transcript_100177/m.289252 type:complete len:212 (+) Transcript_100177:2-637(+)
MSHGRSYISSGPPLAAFAATIQFEAEGSSMATYTPTNAHAQARKWVKMASAVITLTKAKEALLKPQVICHSRVMPRTLVMRRSRAKRMNRNDENSSLVRSARLGNKDKTSVTNCRLRYMHTNVGKCFSSVPGRPSDGRAVTIVTIMSITVKRSKTRSHQNSFGGYADSAKVTSYGTTNPMMSSINQTTTLQTSLKRDCFGSNGSWQKGVGR